MNEEDVRRDKEEDRYPTIVEGKEGSKGKPLVVELHNKDAEWAKEATNLPFQAWEQSVREDSICYFLVGHKNDILLAVKPGGHINYADQESREKDKGGIVLSTQKDYLISSLVEKLLIEIEDSTQL